MAEANANLSSKRALERMGRHCHAVIVHAMHSAKKSVLAQLRAQGLRVAHFSAREISVPANAEFERNRTQLLVEAGSDSYVDRICVLALCRTLK
jgi:hypothetical protein